MKKKYLPIAILLILAVALSAQNHEPIPLYFNYGWLDTNGTHHNVVFSPFNIELFKRNYPILYFQWGAPYELQYSLLMNTQHGNRPVWNVPQPRLTVNINVFVTGNNDNNSEIGIFVPSFRYSPALILLKVGHFVTKFIKI